MHLTLFLYWIGFFGVLIVGSGAKLPLGVHLKYRVGKRIGWLLYCIP
jgi:hypothetical protein